MKTIELFKLYGSIFVDNDEANKSISKTDEKAGGLGEKLGKGIKTAAKWGAAIGVGAIAAGAGMYKMATSSAETTDRIDKLSQKIGMSRKGFQEMDFIASQSGMSIESLQVGFKTLRSSMEQAEKGTGNGAKAFAALGVSVTDSNGSLRDQEEVFNEAVNKLQAMEDGTEKAMLATKLFGKSGQEMMPLLNGAAGSMDAMRQQANDLGLVLGDDAINAGVAFTDTMDQLQRSFGTAVAAIGVEFMPMITKFADFIIANMPTIQAVVQTVFDVLATAISVAVEWLSLIVDAIAGVVETVIEWVQSNSGSMDDLKSMFEEKISSIVDFFKSFFELLKNMWDAWGTDILAVLKAAWDLITPVFQFAFDLIVDIFNVFAALFKGDWEGVWEAVKTLLSNAWDNMKVIIEKALALIEKIVKLAWEVIKTAIKVVLDLIVTIVTGAWKLVGDAFKTALDFISKLTGTNFDGIKNAIDKYMKMVSDIINTVWDYIKKTFENFLKLIKAIVTGDFEGMKNAIKAQMENASGLITTIWNAIKTFFSTVLGNIVSTVGEKFEEVVRKIKDKMDNVLSAISGGFTDALKFVKGVGTDFYNAGANIIGMVADGIKSAVGKVTGAIGDVMSKVRDYLPFSPAKVGPLKTLNKLDFGGPISDSIKNAIPVVNAMMGDLFATPELSVFGNTSLKTNHIIGPALGTAGKSNGNNAQARGPKTFNQTVIINSPKALSPSETARLTKRASEEAALGWR